MIEGINEIHSSLRGRFKGDLLRPGSVGYEDARAIWNGMVSKKPGHGFALRLPGERKAAGRN